MKISDLPEFDMAEMLKTDEDIANYLTAVLEENNEGELTHALGVLGLASDLALVAKDDELGRKLQDIALLRST